MVVETVGSGYNTDVFVVEYKPASDAHELQPHSPVVATAYGRAPPGQADMAALGSHRCVTLLYLSPAGHKQVTAAFALGGTSNWLGVHVCGALADWTMKVVEYDENVLLLLKT
jgi:hypothetical protein